MNIRRLVFALAVALACVAASGADALALSSPPSHSSPSQPCARCSPAVASKPPAPASPPVASKPSSPSTGHAYPFVISPGNDKSISIAIYSCDALSLYITYQGGSEVLVAHQSAGSCSRQEYQSDASAGDQITYFGFVLVDSGEAGECDFSFDVGNSDHASYVGNAAYFTDSMNCVSPPSSNSNKPAASSNNVAIEIGV